MSLTASHSLAHSLPSLPVSHIPVVIFACASTRYRADKFVQVERVVAFSISVSGGRGGGKREEDRAREEEGRERDQQRERRERDKEERERESREKSGRRT